MDVYHGEHHAMRLTPVPEMAADEKDGADERDESGFCTETPKLSRSLSAPYVKSQSLPHPHGSDSAVVCFKLSDMFEDGDEAEPSTETISRDTESDGPQKRQASTIEAELLGSSKSSSSPISVPRRDSSTSLAESATAQVDMAACSSRSDSPTPKYLQHQSSSFFSRFFSKLLKYTEPLAKDSTVLPGVKVF